ncbi:hypothetical protein LAZ67_12002712 [Cordylochernes scorpioides]|uniref:RNase H type-1 domain-containing protein n=1 Tax=Cordylochernes scorpioides TaxID=51811 RepID=A0ABY6L1Z5_9ARAC|nr:hypothetical protein LAZ67_12002712 [Cordylochernes scorpioides]
MAHNSNLLDIPINPKHRTSYPPHKTRNKLICFPHLPDNPHKHETQPELLIALGLQIIEENSSLFNITIYTDVKLLSTKMRSWKKISLSNPRHLSVYKSELSAIDTALKDININSPSKIIIYFDSRAAIYTLQSCFSSQEPLLKSIAKSVNRLPANSSVTGFQLTLEFLVMSWQTLWQRLELLAYLKQENPPHKLDERDLLRTIKTQCLQEWKSDAAHDWYRAGGTSTGSVLPREQQSLISRLKSGHLRTMTFQNDCKVFPLCTKCNSQPATPRHIIDCIDSSIDELYSSPADTIKNLKLYKLDTLVKWGSKAQTLRTTYTSIPMPRLEYASPIWSHASNSAKEKLNLVQAKAAKLILGAVSSTNNSKVEKESVHQDLEERRRLPAIKFTN